MNEEYEVVARQQDVNAERDCDDYVYPQPVKLSVSVEPRFFNRIVNISTHANLTVEDTLTRLAMSALDVDNQS